MIYIAASFERRVEARELKEKCEKNNLEVSSSWLDDVDGYQTGQLELVKRAKRDWKEIIECKVFLMITGDDYSNGGRHTELGIALCNHKSIYLIGKPKNVFEFLPECEIVTDVGIFLEWLERKQVLGCI